MKYVEMLADAKSADTVSTIAEKHEVADFRLGVVGKDDMQPMRLLVTEDKLQSVLDALQMLLGKQPAARIVVLPVEISLPKPTEEELKEEDAATTAREALYAEVEKIPGWT